MRPNYRKLSVENIIEEIHEMEDAYAEALGDETDARTLSALWQEIKILKNEICKRNQLNNDADFSIRRY
jgi:hypothetical protein